MISRRSSERRERAFCHSEGPHPRIRIQPNPLPSLRHPPTYPHLLCIVLLLYCFYCLPGRVGGGGVSLVKSGREAISDNPAATSLGPMATLRRRSHLKCGSRLGDLWNSSASNASRLRAGILAGGLSLFLSLSPSLSLSMSLSLFSHGTATGCRQT